MEILSNKKKFCTYVQVKNSILFLTLILFFVNYFINFNDFIYAILISIILTIIIYENIFKPSYISIKTEENQYKIDLFLPDTRYFYTFSPNKIKSYAISKNDIRFSLVRNNLGLNKLIINFRKEDKYFNFNAIDISWIDIKQLNELIS